jgi:peptidoglycan hydrolase CwlO-like protein
VSANAIGTFAAVVTVIVSTSTALYWTYVTNAKVSNIEEKVNRADVALFGVRAGVPDLEGKVSKEPTPGLIEQVEQIKRTQREMQQAQQEMQQAQQEMQQTQQEILQRLPPARPNRQ